MTRRKYKLSDWEAAKGFLAAGMTIRAAAAAAGVDRNAVLRWSHMREPPEWMWCPVERPADSAPAQGRRSRRARLTYEDRAYIAAQLLAGRTRSQIADALGVARSTVTRELARACGGAYDPRAAHADARRRARRPKARKVDADPALREEVLAMLAERFSPRQVSASLERRHPDDPSMRISHEAVYQAIYVQGKGALRNELAVEKALRSGRSRRVPRSKLPPRPRGKSWVDGCEISTRPPEAADRAVPGHWEGDLVVGSDLRSCLVTLVERRTRFLVARRLECHDTRTVVDLLVEMCGEVPDSARSALLRTLTWDQGCEMADAARFTRETGFKVYFCDPHSPWQKGTNENTNGLIRQYFPKGTSFLGVTDEEVRRMQDSLNSRPRETLGWMTPAEALSRELASAVAMTD